MDRLNKETPQLPPVSIHEVLLEDDTNAPEWIELIPANEFRGRDGRGPFTLHDPEGVIEETGAIALSAGIPIDYDHATDFAAPEGRPAPAAGWIRELTVRGGAIWGRVEWTPHGETAIASREYRYISPVFEHTKDGNVVRLLRAALTNNPNLYLSAINAAQRITGNEDAAIGGGESHHSNSNILKEVRTALSLPDSASAEDILASVRNVALGESAGKEREAHAVDFGRYVPIAHFQKIANELSAIRAERTRERVERAVADAIRAGKITPAQREWAICYCGADQDGFTKFIARQPSMIEEGNDFGNRKALENIDPRERMSSMLSEVDRAVCSRLGIRPEQFIERRKSGRDYLNLTA